MKNILKHVPGFRSNKPGKKIIAIIYYLFSLLFLTVGIGPYLTITSVPFIIFAITSIIKNKDRISVITLILAIIIFGTGLKIDKSVSENANANVKQVASTSKISADDKAKKEAEEKAKKESDDKAKKEAEDKAKAEQKAKEEAELKAKQEAVNNAPVNEMVASIAKDMFKDRFVNVSWEDESKGKLTLTLKMTDNFTNNMIKTGMLSDVGKITKELCKYDKFKTLSNFTVAHETEFVDTYGKTSVGNAQIVSLSMESINKINWPNFLQDNLPKIATTYFLHPALNKN